jgi:hypothetical protein
MERGWSCLIFHSVREGALTEKKLAFRVVDEISLQRNVAKYYKISRNFAKYREIVVTKLKLSQGKRHF